MRREPPNLARRNQSEPTPILLISLFALPASRTDDYLALPFWQWNFYTWFMSGSGAARTIDSIA